jgi:hypothetical protein
VSWRLADVMGLRLLLLPLAMATALASCKDDGTSTDSATTGSVWKELDPTSLNAGGGSADDPGGRGAPGGNVDVMTAGALSFGPSFNAPADAPAAPAGATRISTLDADAVVTGPAVIDGTVTVGGDGARRLTVQGGDLFVAATLRAADAGGAGRALTLEAPDGTIYVTGTIDTSGANTGALPGGALSMTAARIVVTGTLATAGGDSSAGGGQAGEVRVVATGDVILAGTIRARGGAALDGAVNAPAGAAATLAIDTNGNVQLGGRIDLRGGFAHSTASDANLTGGAGGNVAIGSTVAPASVTFALDVSVDGGDGHAAAGGGGNITAHAGGHFTMGGEVRSRGGSIAPGATADGGLAGNFTLDITTIVGNQVYLAGSVVRLDGGDSGGNGLAGGGGHLYARSHDGTVSMAGSLFARGGAARDPDGRGGLGGHVNIFSDANYDGVGGDLTVTPEGVIDVSGGAGTIGGSARNDGTFDVASFPDGQELIAVLLNSDGIHGTPLTAVIDNQGVIIARGGAGNGAGGDVAFHGAGTGGLHDPLSGHIEIKGDGTGAEGQFLSE